MNPAPIATKNSLLQQEIARPPRYFVMTRTVEVEVAGHKFQLRTNAEADYVQQVAHYVEDKIRLLEKKNGATQTHRIALLAALNLAEELFRERDARIQLRNKAKETSRSMLTQLSRLQSLKQDK